MVSFISVTELRYGALRAGWGDLRLRRLTRSLSDLDVVQTEEKLINRCAELRACAPGRIGSGIPSPRRCMKPIGGWLRRPYAVRNFACGASHPDVVVRRAQDRDWAMRSSPPGEGRCARQPGMQIR